MQLFDELNKAIKNKNNGAIDALMYAAKIEFAKDNKFNLELFKKTISDYYKSPTKEHYAIYREGETSKFYQLEETSLQEGELLTEKIEKQISKIDINIKTRSYKINYIKVLRKYSISIGISSKNARKFLLSQFAISAGVTIFIVLIGLLVSLAHFVKLNFQENLTSLEALLYIMFVNFFYVTVASLIVLIIILLFEDKNKIIPSLIAFASLFILLTAPFLTAIKNHDVFTYEGIVTIKEISNFHENDYIKTVKVKNASGETFNLYAHKSLKLKSGKTYSVKGYKNINIVTEADEITPDELNDKYAKSE